MPPLKALLGGGYIRGRGDFAYSEANPHLQIQTPPPYEKKQKLRILKKRYFAVAQYDKKNKEKGKRKKAKDSILVDCYMLILQWWSARV